MKTYLIAYIATAAVFLAVDALWLGVVARDFYRGQLGDLMSPNPSLGVAAAFYLLYVVGLVYFAVAPALASGQWTTALVSGALFGFFAYATYDLTNLAILRGYTSTLAMVDLAWGTALSGFSATCGYLVTRVIAGGD